ncbi:MAG: hypothetical protein OXR62_11990 [Ahrensia sp.]|nr:hypothetical protein [Ahrensia sp.]
MRRVKSSCVGVVLVASVSALSGCTGSSTYGTGVSQEAQLVSDLANIVPLGTSERKEPIDYSSRPKLVRAPATAAASLPAPAETVGASQSAYFPTNPEERRLAAGSDKPREFTRRDGGLEYTLAGDADAPAASGEPILDTTRGRADDGTGDREPSAAEIVARSQQGSEERRRRMQELSGGATLGAGPRRYLTQPPQEYRQPAQTAAIGSVGETEYSETDKKPIFSIFSGRSSRENVKKAQTKKPAS